MPRLHRKTVIPLKFLFTSHVHPSLPQLNPHSLINSAVWVQINILEIVTVLFTRTFTKKVEISWWYKWLKFSPDYIHIYNNHVYVSLLYYTCNGMGRLINAKSYLPVRESLYFIHVQAATASCNQEGHNIVVVSLMYNQTAEGRILMIPYPPSLSLVALLHLMQFSLITYLIISTLPMLLVNFP